MIPLLATLALRLGVPQRFARAAGIAGLILAAIVLLFAARATLRHLIISRHEAKVSAQNERKARAADTRASIERRADDARITKAQKEMHDAIAKAPDTAPDPARVRLGCERLRRAGVDTSSHAECR